MPVLRSAFLALPIAWLSFPCSKQKRMLPNPLNVLKVVRAARLITGEKQTALFVSPLLRAREIKMASALRRIGWKVVLIYIETTPFKPEHYFDIVIRAQYEKEAHTYAKLLSPRICHVFSGAVDDLLLRFCRDKPGPVIIDMNDVFCPSLFDYCHERFEPTRECLEKATALCARDVQAKRAQNLDGFRIPQHKLFFPEYSWLDGPHEPGAAPKGDPNEVHVVSVGTFTLETLGMYDSAYLQLARMLTEQRIHLHIYPHWFYRKSKGSSFNWDRTKDFADFFRLEEQTQYLHIHESVTLHELARELPQYDFGIVSGGCTAFGQELKILKQEYMESCYSGRISDYLDARLPVLINQEVGFNYRLLKRYGLAVDLAGILRPGFRDELLAIKRDRGRAAVVNKAVRKLSLDRNVSRLSDFYKRIAEDDRRFRVRLGLKWSLAAMLPLLGLPFRRMEHAIQGLNRTADYLRDQLAQEKEESHGLNQTVNDLRDELEKEKAKTQQIEKLNLTVDHLRDELSKEKAKLGEKQSVLERLERRLRERMGRYNPENAKLHLEVEARSRWADEISGLLNWPEIRERAAQTTGMAELLEMTRWFSTGVGPLSETSSCWEVLNFKNFEQLLSHGYDKFKRTIGFNYFNFLIQEGDPQIAYLEANLNPAEREQCREAAASLPDDPYFEWHDQMSYRYFILLLWNYTRKVDVEKYLDRLEEPVEGHPLVVPVDSQRASQDLANSLLEYYAMSEVVNFEKCQRVLEIGGGYGRDAYIVLKLNPHIQYTLVDIPPALWVAQRYLSSVFKERTVFQVRDFRSYEEVSVEMEQASIVCLLPHQLELLPDRQFDLSLNISSFGEMRPGQIKAYFEILERLTKGHFYMKQWKASQNAFDHLSLTEDDYPASQEWTQIYSRTCPVQTLFFESLYQVGKR
jgi:putative sugar O-methyltransferase